MSMRCKNTRLASGPWIARPWSAPLLGILVGLIAGRSTYAADLVPPRWRASSTLNDCQVAALARRSMMADPVLAQFNIGVTVADSTATIWGTVPDADIAAKIKSRLCDVGGISTVVVDLRIHPEGQLWPSNGDLASAASPVSQMYRTGLASVYPRSGTASFIGTVPPVTLSAALPGEPARMPSVTLQKPMLTDTNLADQVEMLRRSVPRFREVGVRVAGSMVHVRSYNAPPDIVQDFTRRLSQLPGVSRVILLDTKRPNSLAIP